MSDRRDRRQETWKAADVRCPFYQRDNLSNIECEGVLEDTTEILRFRTFSIKNHHMGTYCAGRYEGCPKHKSIIQNKYLD